MKICSECRTGTLGPGPDCAECGSDLSGVANRTGADLVGLVIDRKYELVEFLGDGAMGWVYRGTHRGLYSSVAIKLMKPPPEPDENRSRRFRREAEAAAGLNHPHIISVIDFGQTQGGLLYLVSEFLRGITLNQMLADTGPLPLPRVVRIFSQILSAVDEAHSIKVVHRDLKPDNIMVTPLRSGDDLVKVLDFGIAKVASKGNARLTAHGTVVGTPGYMAPEQIRGLEADARSDLYACGVILFGMLTGHEAFVSESPLEVLSLQLHNEPPRLSEVAPELGFADELEQVVAKAMARDADERFANVAEFRDALGPAVAASRRSDGPCPFCGEQIKTDSRFCAQCGSRLRADSKPIGIIRDSSPKPPTVGDDPPRPRTQKQKALRGQRQRKTTATRLRRDTLSRRLKSERTLDLPLVDREREMDAIMSFLAGESSVLGVVGRQGCGKSRLLTEVGKIAQGLGCKVFAAGPDPAMARQPWYPVRRLVSDLLGFEEGDMEALSEAANRAGLVPADVLGLAELFGLRDRDNIPEHAVRLRETLSSACRALLDSKPAHNGLCLLVDDLDELDGASRNFLVRLCAGAKKTQVKVALACESAAFVTDLADVILEPGPIRREGIERLGAAVMQRPGDSWARLGEIVAAKADGNALHVMQALRLLGEGGREVDASLPDLIAIRVGRLPAPALRLLQVICTVGWAAPVGMAKALFEETERWDDVVKLLVRLGFVLPGADEELTVTHPLIAETVREAMPARARRQLHREILELDQHRIEDPVAMARHAYEAKLGRLSLDLVENAAHVAEGWLDDSGAATNFRRALHIARWQLLLDERDERCLELSWKLADAMRYSQDTLGVELILKESLTAARHHPPTRSRLLRSLARLELGRNRPTEALHTIREAMGAALLAGRPHLLAETYIELGHVLERLGDVNQAADELEEGVLMATGGDGAGVEKSSPGLWRLLSALAELRSRQGEDDLAVTTATRALEFATRESSLVGAGRCRYLLARLLDAAGRRSEAGAHYEEAEQAFQRLGDRRSTGECLLARAGRTPTQKNELASQALGLFQQISWQEGITAASRLTAGVIGC